MGLSLLATSFILYPCNKDDDSTTVTPTTGISILSTVQAKYKSMVTISTSDNSITLCSNGTPDHVSPYWDTTNALYEAQMSGSTVNPGMIGTQNYCMTIPTNPAETSNKEATTLGPLSCPS